MISGEFAGAIHNVLVCFSSREARKNSAAGNTYLGETGTGVRVVTLYDILIQIR